MNLKNGQLGGEFSDDSAVFKMKTCTLIVYLIENNNNYIELIKLLQLTPLFKVQSEIFTYIVELHLKCKNKTYQ